MSAQDSPTDPQLPADPELAPVARPAKDGAPAAAPRRPGRFRRWLLRPFAWSLAIVAFALLALALYLRSDAAKERLRQFLVARLVEATGRPVEVRAVSLDLWPLALEVHDLRLPGPTAADPPVVVLPYGEVQASITGLRHPVIHLERILLRQPEIFVEVREDGSNNLPQLPESSGGGNRLEIEIGTLAVVDGMLRLDELAIPLSIAAEQVRASLTGQGRDKPFLAHLAAERLTTTLPGAQPLPAALVAEASISTKSVEIVAARLDGGDDLRAEAKGSVVFEKGATRVALDLVASGQTEVLEKLGWLQPGQVAGPFAFSGRLAANGAEWLLDGRLESERIAAAGFVVEDLKTTVAGKAGELRFDVEHLAYGGGEGAGTVEVNYTQPPVAVAANLGIRGLDLIALFQRLGLPLTGLQTVATGQVAYRFTVDQPLAGDGRADVLLVGGEPVAPAGALRPLALSGQTLIDIRDGTLTSDAIHLTSPGQEVDLLDLSVHLQPLSGGFRYHLASQDVGRLRVALPLEPTPEPPVWFPATGRGTLDGSLRFGGDAPLAADMTFDLTGVRSPGVVADRLTGGFRLTPDGLSGLALDLRRFGAGGSEGRLLATGDVPFGAGRGGIRITAEATNWPYADLAGFVPTELPLAGPVTGRLDLAGETDALSGKAALSLAPAVIANVVVDRAEARFSFDRERLTFERVILDTEAGRVEGAGEMGFGPGNPLSLTVSAPRLSLAGAPLAGLLGNHVNGVLALAGKVDGSLQHPKVSAVVSTPGLELEGRTLGPATVTVKLDDGRLTANGDLPGLLTLTGGGTVGNSAGSPVDLRIAIAGDDLRSLAQLASGLDLPDLAGSFQGEIAVSGPLTDPRIVLTLPQLVLHYATIDARNLEPVVLRLEESQLWIDSFYLGNAAGPEATGDRAAGSGEIFLRGQVGLSPGAPMAVNLQGTFPASWLDPLVEGAHFQGTFSALGKLTGALTAIHFDGQADLAAGQAVLAGFPHALDDLRAVVLISPDQVLLDTFQGRFAGGTLQASGSFSLDPQPLADYRLQATLTNFHMRYPEGWVLDGNAELTATPTPGGRVIRGRVDLERAFYVSDIELDLFQLLSGFLRRQRLQVASAEPILVATQLDVLVDGPDALRVRNNLADLHGDIDLVVRGSLAKPVLVGQVEAEAGGKLTYGDSEYEIERGLLTFASLDRIDPVIDLVARSRIREYEVTLSLSGTLERLNANLSSDPPLPDLDVLALLSTGSRFDETSTGTTTPGQGAVDSSAAETFLYGQAASAISSRVKTLFGFDKFRIDPTTTAGGSVGAARFIVGKRIRRDLYVTYQFNASETQQNVVQVEWQVSPGLVIVVSDVDGDQYAVDFRWERRF